jgi:hypothetical protein
MVRAPIEVKCPLDYTDSTDYPEHRTFLFFLRTHWPIIEMVAARLAERGIVRAAELARICRRKSQIA